MTSQTRPMEDALDEMVFRDDGAMMEMQGVHDNSILFYFARSPFFVQQSNNALLYSQAIHNPKLTHVLSTRASFEARLKTMSGLEYIVAEQPADMAPGTGTGVWVIRKQTRRKRPGMEDEITVHAAYFIVAGNIYQAPSAADVIGSRLMAISTTLSKFISQAATLSQFSPALGHTYPLPPIVAKSKIGDMSSTREGTPMPDSQQSSKKPDASTQTNEQISNQMLADTISISLRYGEEYMDENLVTGQPGSFHMSKTGKKDQEKGKLAIPSIVKTVGTPKPGPALAVKTDVPPPLVRKGSKVEKSPKTPGGAPKPKRRKSKPNVNAVSPT